MTWHSKASSTPAPTRAEGDRLAEDLWARLPAGKERLTTPGDIANALAATGHRHGRAAMARLAAFLERRLATRLTYEAANPPPA